MEEQSATEGTPPELDLDAVLQGDATLEFDPAREELAPEPEPVGAGAPATAASRVPALTPAPDRTGPRVFSPIRVPSRDWGRPKRSAPAFEYEVEPSVPTDVKIVIALLVITAVVAAIMVGVLMSNFLAAVIAALVLLVGLSCFLWMSRL